MKSLESREIGKRTFADIRRDVRKALDGMKAKIDAEMQKLAKEGNQKLENDFGVNAALNISDTVMLGVFEESNAALGFTMAMKVGVSTDKGRDESRSVVACLMVPVNGRLVYLYSTGPFASKADQERVELGVRVWRDDVVTANPRVQGPPGGFDWLSVGRSTVIGAVVGVMVGLAGWLAKKFKRTQQ